MRRVVINMQNYLFADALAKALTREDSDFEPHMSLGEDETIELCRVSLPYAVLMEVARYKPWLLCERIKLAGEIKALSPASKTVLIVDENADRELAQKVKQAKKDGLIDQFIYSSISAAYLMALVDAL